MSRLDDSRIGDSPRIFVLATVRNCEKTLGSSIGDIERFVGGQTVSQWFIVESDSEDKTVETLAQLSVEVSGFRFESLGALRHTVPDRVKRIAIARQRALETAAKFIRGDDFVIVADLDGITSSLQAGGFLRATHQLGSFDVVTANSKSFYYDILALRAKGWVEEDYRLTRQKLIDRGVSSFEAHNESLVKKQRRISHLAAPIEVQSAFGGIAIYSGKAFLAGEYESGGSFECEHVGFHRQLTENGYRICIDPGLVVAPEWRHVALASPPLSFLWKLLVRFGPLMPKSLAGKVSRKVFS